MEEKDFNYLQRIRNKDPALFKHEFTELKAANPKHPAISKIEAEITGKPVEEARQIELKNLIDKELIHELSNSITPEDILKVKIGAHDCLKYIIIEEKIKVFKWVLSLNLSFDPIFFSEIIKQENVRFLSSLLSCQPNLIYVYDAEGKTLLHYAVIKRDISKIDILLKRKADVFAKNSKKTSSAPLDIAQRQYFDIRSDSFKLKECSKKILIKLFNATRYVELYEEDDDVVIAFKLITTLLYKAQRYSWKEEPCLSLQRYSIAFLKAGFPNDSRDWSKYNPELFAKFLEENETLNGTFYGSYLSDDSDSDHEQKINSLGESEKIKMDRNVHIRLGYASVEKFTKKLKEPKFVDEIKFEATRDLRLELRERAQIHNSRQDKKQLDIVIKELNEHISSGKLYHEAAALIYKRYHKHLFVAQYRGITYMTTHFGQTARQAHRKKQEIDKPQYSPSVLLGVTNSQTMREFTKKFHEQGNESDTEIELWAHSLKERMLAMRRSGKIHYREYTYSHVADLLQDIYSKDYSKFLKIISQHNIFREYLFNGYLPFVSTADVPYHPLKYAYGIKPYKGKEQDRLRPRWQSNGRSERPYSGKVYASLHPLEDYDDDAVHHICSLNAQGNIQIDNLIIAERECTFFSYLPAERIKIQHLAKYPSFTRYKSIFLDKYGLTPEMFYLFKRLLEQSKPHQCTYFKQILGEWLCAYHEVKLVEQMQKEANSRNGYLIYRGENGLFHASEPPLDSPFRNPGKEERKIVMKQDANSRRNDRKTYNKEPVYFFKENYSFSVSEDLVRKLESRQRFIIDALLISREETMQPIYPQDVGLNPNPQFMIHYFTFNRNYRAVKALLEARALVNVRNADGDTALHIAVFNNFILIARLLLDYGANIDIPNNNSITVRDISNYIPWLLSYIPLAKSINYISSTQTTYLEKGSNDIENDSKQHMKKISPYEKYLKESIINTFLKVIREPEREYHGYQLRIQLANALSSFWVLKHTNIAEILKEILLGTQNDNPLVRETAVIILGESNLLDNIKIIDALISCLSDDDLYVRAHAADALCRLGLINKECIDILFSYQRGFYARYSYVIGTPDTPDEAYYTERPDETLVKLPQFIENQCELLLGEIIQPDATIDDKKINLLGKVICLDEVFNETKLMDVHHNSDLRDNVIILTKLLNIQQSVVKKINFLMTKVDAKERKKLYSFISRIKEHYIPVENFLIYKVFDSADDYRMTCAFHGILSLEELSEGNKLSVLQKIRKAEVRENQFIFIRALIKHCGFNFETCNIYLNYRLNNSSYFDIYRIVELLEVIDGFDKPIVPMLLEFLVDEEPDNRFFAAHILRYVDKTDLKIYSEVYSVLYKCFFDEPTPYILTTIAETLFLLGTVDDKIIEELKQLLANDFIIPSKFSDQSSEEENKFVSQFSGSKNREEYLITCFAACYVLAKKNVLHSKIIARLFHAVQEPEPFSRGAILTQKQQNEAESILHQIDPLLPYMLYDIGVLLKDDFFLPMTISDMEKLDEISNIVFPHITGNHGLIEILVDYAVQGSHYKSYWALKELASIDSQCFTSESISKLNTLLDSIDSLIKDQDYYNLIYIFLNKGFSFLPQAAIDLALIRAKKFSLMPLAKILKLLFLKQVKEESYSNHKLILKEIRGVSEKRDSELEIVHPSSKSLNKIKARPTKGGGDCALHAILGEWNTESWQFECANVLSAREKLRLTIANTKMEEKLGELVRDGIRDWIMSDSNFKNLPQSKLLRRSYHQFVSAEEEGKPECWQQFERELKKCKDIEEYVNYHTKGLNASFKDKFYSVLALTGKQEDVLYGLITSIDNLQRSFESYNKKINVPYRWEENISQGVKEEFASFVGTPRVWLAPLELNIIAHVFEKTIHYYPNLGAEMMEFNPGKSTPVVVQFNGADHFERCLPYSLDGYSEAEESPARLIGRFGEIARAPSVSVSRSSIEESGPLVEFIDSSSCGISRCNP
jgi:ankyrin repeat protein